MVRLRRSQNQFLINNACIMFLDRVFSKKNWLSGYPQILFHIFTKSTMEISNPRWAKKNFDRKSTFLMTSSTSKNWTTLNTKIFALNTCMDVVVAGKTCKD